MSDAAWGVRKDLQRQGGYLVLLSHPKVLRGEESEYIILDWRSYGLSRVSRSSLNSEAQACAGAMDALEYLMVLWQGCLSPTFTLQEPGEFGKILQSALVIDAKAPYG